MFKLLMSWNIRPGHEDDYLDFVIHEFSPGLSSIGIRPTDAWYTYYGEGPQILTGGISDDMEQLHMALASPEWQDLKKRLMTYVTDYQQKIVRATGGFQI